MCEQQLIFASKFEIQCAVRAIDEINSKNNLTPDEIQYVSKLVSPLVLFDSFPNPNCQDILVYIGSYSEVPLSVEPVLFLTQNIRTYGVVYLIVTLIQLTPRYPTLENILS